MFGLIFYESVIIVKKEMNMVKFSFLYRSKVDEIFNQENVLQLEIRLLKKFEPILSWLPEVHCTAQPDKSAVLVSS